MQISDFLENKSWKAGVAAFHQKDYFKAHAFWELLWRELSSGDFRKGVQASIQLAASQHLLRSGRPLAAERVFKLGLEKMRSIDAGLAKHLIAELSPLPDGMEIQL